MCCYSMVIDHYAPRFTPWIQPVQPFVPVIPLEPPPPPRIFTPEEAERAQKLIKQFQDALAAAKKVDTLTAQPNCEDPEKAKLVERVAALEKELASLKKKRKRPTRIDTDRHVMIIKGRERSEPIEVITEITEEKQ